MKTTVQNIKKAQSVMAFLLILLGAAFTHVSWANQTMYFIHNDHLGTPQVVTDANQSVVWQADYQPFGEVDVTTNLIEQDARFPGQYIDKATGLHYNYFRDYDPTIGRYVQSDPIGLDGGLNTYGYVGGNPLIFIDPFGLVFPGCYPAPEFGETAMICPDGGPNFSSGNSSAFPASTNNTMFSECIAECKSRGVSTEAAVGCSLVASATLSLNAGAAIAAEASCLATVQHLECAASCPTDTFQCE